MDGENTARMTGSGRPMTAAVGTGDSEKAAPHRSLSDSEERAITAAAVKHYETWCAKVERTQNYYDLTRSDFMDVLGDMVPALISDETYENPAALVLFELEFAYARDCGGEPRARGPMV